MELSIPGVHLGLESVWKFLRFWMDISGEDYIKHFSTTLIKDRAPTHVRAQGQVPFQVLMSLFHVSIAPYAHFRLVCWQRRLRRHRIITYKTYEIFHMYHRINLHIVACKLLFHNQLTLMHHDEQDLTACAIETLLVERHSHSHSSKFRLHGEISVKRTSEETVAVSRCL